MMITRELLELVQDLLTEKRDQLDQKIIQINAEIKTKEQQRDFISKEWGKIQDHLVEVQKELSILPGDA